MGFWGTLGKIGAIAGGVLGAPFTGGLSLAATGPALSSLLGGGKGSSSKSTTNPADPKTAQAGAWGDLDALIGKTSGYADEFGKRGLDAGDDATKYFQTLLSGDRNALNMAVAPAANAARDAGDAMKRERAEMGTARGGGVAAENTMIDENTRAQIDNLIGVLGPQAAEALMQMSSQDLAALSSLLGIQSGAAGNLGAQATDMQSGKDARSGQMWSSLIGGIADIGSAVLMPNP